MYGVIDIGSNTIRLVIYKVEDDKIVPMINKKISAGIAGYVNKRNQLSRDGINKTIETLREFKEIISFVKVKEVFPFATASLRNIENSSRVIWEVKKCTGFEIKVLSGEEEALFDYYGVLQSIDIESGLVVDIGGGSTEIVSFDEKKVLIKKSVPIGSLNLYKKCIDGLIPSKKEIIAIRDIVEEFINEKDMPKDVNGICYLCGVGGTARAIQTLLYDMNLINYEEYNSSMLKDLMHLLNTDSDTFYENLLKSSADRIHTFTPGLIVMNYIAEFYGVKKIITSKYGVREGYLRKVLEKRGVL